MAVVLAMAGTASAQVNIATNNGYWTNAATWSAGVPQSDHDVVIPSGITVTNTGLATSYINSLTITGTLTHATNVATEVNKINLNITGSMTVAAGGAVNVNGKGYGFNAASTTIGYGPGASPGRAGASHGGQGASSYDYTASTVTYGSVTNPVNCGSGCPGRSAGQGSNGGGAIILQVGGTLTVEAGGQITADGNFVADQSTAAGGSVNITANAFAGGGTISAKGGAGGTNAGGAGGGRIALVAGSGDSSQFSTLTVTAVGGSGTANKAAAGTIYMKVPGQTYGTLLVKNHGTLVTPVTSWTNEINRFDTIITTNCGVLVIGTNAVLDLTGTTLASDSTTASILSRIILDSNYTNRFILPAAFTVAGTLSVSGTNTFVLPGDLTMGAGGIFTHEGPNTTESDKLILNIASNVTVQSGGSICVKGRGYGWNGSTLGYGPGGAKGRSGAAHGGQGTYLDGTVSLITYGSVINPVNYGSGCAGGTGSGGGGAAILQVGGTVTVNAGGSINGDGQQVNDNSAAAGGSIKITANAFSGGGTISAIGGTCNTARGAAGGGRISLVAGSGVPSQFDTLTISARGGDGATDGGAGTIYLETASQGANHGTVWINNGGQNMDAYTGIPSHTNGVYNELASATVIATNKVAVIAPNNTTIGDLLIYTNCTWTLGANLLYVNTLEHSLENQAVSGPGAINRVDNYYQVIWSAPVINNIASTNLQPTSADLVGTLSVTGTACQVLVYWSPNNNANAAAWRADGSASNQVVGTYTNVSGLSITSMVAVAASVPYYWTMVASNAVTNIWATPNLSFETVGSPAVNNSAGAANVQSTSATLRGTLTDGTYASGYIAWGDNNPGTDNTGEWDHVESLGVVQEGVQFSTNVTGLSAMTVHYYRCYVTNQVSYGWSAVSEFTTANTATNSGSWTNAAIWSAGVPQSTDFVFIPAGITVTNTGLGPYTIKSLMVAGTLTHQTNTSTEVNKINLIITSNLTIQAGGAVTANGKGYGWNGTTAGYGPGFAINRSGAAHGGQGAQGLSGAPSLITYDSVTNPVMLGSGCSGGSAANGSGGGGAVILQVGGTVTVEATGIITAEGNFVADQSTAAGGTVNITANAFSGTGTINAKGGAAGTNGGGGGGGRIALKAGSGTLAQFDTLTITAAGGSATGYKAAAGTIYMKVPGQTYGTLLVKSHGSATSGGALTSWESETNRFDSIITTNYGVLAIGTNAVLDLTGTVLSSDSTTASILSRIILYSNYTNRFILPAAFTVGGTLSVSGTNTFILPGDLIMASGGIFTHEGPNTTESDKLILNIASNVTVQSGGSICIKGRGYGWNGSTLGYGPGGAKGRSGAAHGGQGTYLDGTVSLITYGSVINPVNYGSGCAYAAGSGGGGAAILQVGGTVTVNAGGSINADGQQVNDDSAAAGGSVNIRANAFSGSGTISAIGGTCNTARGAAGGGRISLVAGSGGPSQFDTLAINARGGDGATDGGAGTIYLEVASQGANRGNVWINNGAQNIDAYTGIMPHTNAVTNELQYAAVIMTNKCGVFSTNSTAICDLLIHTNCYWALSTNMLTVNTFEHQLENPSIDGPGQTNRVSTYSNVLWLAIRNTAATNITATTADLCGKLNATNTNFDIYVYWSTNNNANSAAWLADSAATNKAVGSFTNVSLYAVTGSVSSLSSDTTYYYTMVASNTTTYHWAKPNASFMTMAAPVVSNGTPSSVSATSATLRATLTYGSIASAWICWGMEDGGKSGTGNWNRVESIGTVVEDVEFSVLVSPLVTNQTYWYRCYVSNETGTAWSDPATSFSGKLVDETGVGRILVQNYSITLGGTVTSNSTPLVNGQTAENSVLFMSFSSSGQDQPRYVFPDVYLSGTNIIVRRAAQNGNTVVVNASVVQFDTSAVKVQQGTFSMSGSATTTNIAITAVDTNKAAFAFSQMFGDAGSSDKWYAYSVRGYFSDASHLTFVRSTGGDSYTVDGHWYLFEAVSNLFSVQERDIVVNGAKSATAAINAVTTNETFLISSHSTTESADDAQDGCVRVWLDSSTQVKAQRANTADRVDVHVFVVSAPGMTVQRGDFDYISSFTTQTDPITAVNPDYSMAWCPSQNGRMEASDTADSDGVSRAHQRVGLDSATMVRGTRGLTGAAAVGNWEVVDWSGLLGNLVGVRNLGPSQVTNFSARLNATLYAPTTNLTVYVHFGVTNGGTSYGGWSESYEVGSWTNVACTNISYLKTGLSDNSTYWYTFRATNSTTNIWASPSWMFSTPVSSNPHHPFDCSLSQTNIVIQVNGGRTGTIYTLLVFNSNLTNAASVLYRASNTTSFTYIDTNALGSVDRRFYLATETTSGVISTSSWVFTAFRKQLDTNAWYKYALGIDYGVANKLNSTLGSQLAQGLAGNNTKTIADLFYLLDTNGNWQMCYLNGSGIWCDYNSGNATNTTVLPWQSFWIKRRINGSNASPIYSGYCFSNAAPVTFRSNDWHMITWPLPWDRMEGDGPQQGWGFAAAGGQKGGSWLNSDVLTVGDGADLRFYHVGTNGRWYAVGQTNPASTVTLHIGDSYYYMHRGTGMTWTATGQ